MHLTTKLHNVATVCKQNNQCYKCLCLINRYTAVSVRILSHAIAVHFHIGISLIKHLIINFSIASEKWYMRKKPSSVTSFANHTKSLNRVAPNLFQI